MSEEIFGEDNFGESSEMTAQTIDWGKVGDSVVGTFIKSNRGVKTKFGDNTVYDILVERGEFHKINKDKSVQSTPTILKKGDIWSTWGRNDIFDGQMNSLKPGQIIKIVFESSKPSTLGNDAKIVKIFAPKDNEGNPKMNAAYVQSVSGLSEPTF